jgi:hypothetical protein
MGFIAKMRTWLFSKTARYFAKPMTGKRKCFKAGKGYERRGLTIDMSGKALRLKILFTVYSMAQQFHEHKMDVKMDLLTRNKRKKSGGIS